MPVNTVAFQEFNSLRGRVPDFIQINKFLFLISPYNSYTWLKKLKRNILGKRKLGRASCSLNTALLIRVSGWRGRSFFKKNTKKNHSCFPLRTAFLENSHSGITVQTELPLAPFSQVLRNGPFLVMTL